MVRGSNRGLVGGDKKFLGGVAENLLRMGWQKMFWDGGAKCFGGVVAKKKNYRVVCQKYFWVRVELQTFFSGGMATFFCVMGGCKACSWGREREGGGGRCKCFLHKMWDDIFTFKESIQLWFPKHLHMKPIPF